VKRSNEVARYRDGFSSAHLQRGSLASIASIPPNREEINSIDFYAELSAEQE